MKTSYWKLAVAGAASVGLLTACSGNSGGGSGDSGGDGGGSGDGELSGEVEVWSWNVAAASLEQAAEQFMEEHPDVEITVQDSSTDDVYERLTVGLGSGGSGLPDVVSLESSQLENYKSQFPDGFMNLSENGFDEHADKFTEFKVDAAQDENGDFISMPWDIGPAGVFYRVDLFEEAGVNADDIETWDDYVAAGEKVVEETDAFMLPVQVTSDDSPYRVFLNQQGVNYFNEDGEIQLDTEEAQAAMDLMAEMSEKELIYNANTWDAMVGATVNGDVASVPTGAWYSGTIMDQAPDMSGQWGVMELPTFEEGTPQAANSGGSDLAVLESSENQDAAYAFAEYFTTSEDVQIQSFEEHGLFPSLTSTYEDPIFEEPVEYFNDEPAYGLLADTTDNIESPIFNSDIPRAEDVIMDAQSSVILEGNDPNNVMNNAVERLASETGRETSQ
ncbi:ABC transporter substrate-binding protein [Marinococcus sp. PL1-022]|uniref:ABC transporter substrate-binding protein n=1 Tax=Marinococcus sp. PL1-022 TaxID=3095363 RepID=UPI0029C51E43|nr:extracellular solute-binding protein [Marinococcus sp. PL1-022]MDX6153981.1 extracellular solute-binding protein [Marinococcus sp. PL1-022]